MVSMQGKSIMQQHPDDESAMEVVSHGMEVCGFEVPIAFFNKQLDIVEAKLAADPESPTPCQEFARDFTMYFALVDKGSGTQSDGTPITEPEDRVKAELSGRAKKLCPLVAGMMGF